MKIETALNHRRRAMASLKDAYSKARVFHSTHETILADTALVYASVAHCPGWVRDYLRGADEILLDALFKHDLEYCSTVESKLVSHYRNSPRYYETMGFKPEQVCKKGVGGSHYWKGTDKPF